LYHGVFGFNRGLIEAVEAMHLLREACPAVRLWLVGDGPAYAAVQERIAALRLEERVLLQPALPYEQIPACVQLCDVGLLAYPNAEFWHTSNPLKLLEYMAMGKPVILRDTEAFRAAIADSGGGLFLNDNAPATIARALTEAYQRRHELPALGAGGRARVLAQYTWAAQARTLAAFLTAVTRPEIESS
jgi:glycosyltransferase involved in cell wall biosynthesis